MGRHRPFKPASAARAETLDLLAGEMNWSIPGMAKCVHDAVCCASFRVEFPNVLGLVLSR
jgi:hypothetical protein